MWAVDQMDCYSQRRRTDNNHNNYYNNYNNNYNNNGLTAENAEN